MITPMATEFRVIRKKRTSSGATSSNHPPEGDHRKRRRNRTTQSCLNCHSSKRMCDRKRPCGRCIQLGLTGLCVYEIDDPSQRSHAQDEGSRLRQRVAELEGVIRELKNKPHPRWARSGSSSDEEFSKSPPRTRSCSASGSSVVEARPPSDPTQHFSANPDVGSNEQSLEKPMAPLLVETVPSDDPSPSIPSSVSPAPATGNSVPFPTFPFPCFDIYSPVSAPSTALVTPTEEHPQTQITVAEGQPLMNEIDLASLFMPYPGLPACNEGLGHTDHGLRANTHSQTVDPCSTRYNCRQFLAGHCGCLNEAVNYNAVLELSLRLRKAADILSHSANHRFNNGCPLNCGIVDLDSFATTALGNMTISPNDIGPVHLRSRANIAPSAPVTSTFSPMGCISPTRVPGISMPSLRSPRRWTATSCAPDPLASWEETFMNWEPSRRS